MKYLVLAIIQLTCLAFALGYSFRAYAEPMDGQSGTVVTGPNYLAFNSKPSIMISDMVTIRPDGTIEFGKDYNPNDAAREFWKAIGIAKPDKDCK